MNSIVLTGFAGTGKSTIGQRVARQLGYPFIDMDWLIEERHRCTIREMFETSGEPFFRQVESDICQELAKVERHVIATGGGTLVSPTNLAILSPGNLVICLDCDAEVLWERLANKSDRPLLNHADSNQKKHQFLALLQQRQPAYARIHIHVDTTNRTIDEIVEKIVLIGQEHDHDY